MTMAREEQSLCVNVWCDSPIEYYVSGKGGVVFFVSFLSSSRADSSACCAVETNKIRGRTTSAVERLRRLDATSYLLSHLAHFQRG